MQELLSSYLPVIIFISLCMIIGTALLIAPFLVAYKAPDAEKLSAYECGFNPFDDSRMKFDVRFYLVAIAFLVFDVELLFLYPWAVASRNSQGIDHAIQSGWVANRFLVFGEVMVFIALLAAGFVYAWRKGVFRWR